MTFEQGINFNTFKQNATAKRFGSTLTPYLNSAKKFKQGNWNFRPNHKQSWKF